MEGFYYNPDPATIFSNKEVSLPIQNVEAAELPPINFKRIIGAARKVKATINDVVLAGRLTSFCRLQAKYAKPVP
jgi:NRPS condensation-like uncharacterized protein